MEPIMTVNGIEYQVVKLLGKGKGGYSYLVTRDGVPYTLKQIHHEPCDYYTFGDKLASELGDYERLKAVGVPMPELLAVDSPLERILKEYIDGPTVYDLVREDRLDPGYIRQMDGLCEKLYAAGLNIDYFPTNFIPRNGILIYIDYECNNYMDEWNFRNWGIQYWSKTEAFCEYTRNHG